VFRVNAFLRDTYHDIFDTLTAEAADQDDAAATAAALAAIENSQTELTGSAVTPARHAGSALHKLNDTVEKLAAEVNRGCCCRFCANPYLKH